MVSRKKARGKARKAAKKAKAEDEFAALLPFSLAQFKTRCTHGWNHDEYANDHDCYKLIVDVLKGFRRTDNTYKFLGATNEVMLKYPEITSDPSKLEWIASAFVSFGTELFLTEPYDKCACAYAVCYSDWIHQYVATRHKKSAPTISWTRLHELLFADKRRLIGYLKKRIPCSCLDSSYKAVKHLPKNGLCCSVSCSVPGRLVEVSKMWSCEDCRRRHYCSEECQADDWPRHRKNCKVWSHWEVNGGSSQAE